MQLESISLRVMVGSLRGKPSSQGSSETVGNCQIPPVSDQHANRREQDPIVAGFGCYTSPWTPG